MKSTITIKNLPEIHLACVNFKGDKNINHAYNTLLQWAIPQKLMQNPDTKLITLFHDSFKNTPPDNVRMSACITVSENIPLNKNISATTIHKGKHIVGNFVIKIDEFEQAWKSLFGWMNKSGYTKAPKSPFEIYHNNFNEHPEKKCIVDLCIPIL